MLAKISKFFSAPLIIVLLGLPLTQDALASDEDNGWRMGSRMAVVNATDDWLPGIPTGDLYCSEGDIDLSNPLVPRCPPGTTLEVRNVTALGLMHADDPRLAGLLSFVVNGSLDASDFSGPVWGTFVLAVDACEGVWEGTWDGLRTFVPGQPNPIDTLIPPPGFGGVWIGKLDLRGTGAGECIDRLGMKAVEIVTTLTPMPVPYEMILPCHILGCLPEGVSSAKILGPWHP